MSTLVQHTDMKSRDKGRKPLKKGSVLGCGLHSARHRLKSVGQGSKNYMMRMRNCKKDFGSCKLAYDWRKKKTFILIWFPHST